MKLDIASRFEMLEMVQTVLAHITGMLGFEEDAAYNVSVAVRESVVNAIKHGNQHDESKSHRGREPAQVLRPRHLLHAELHGRSLVFVPRARRNGRPHAQEEGLIRTSVCSRGPSATTLAA